MTIDIDAIRARIQMTSDMGAIRTRVQAATPGPWGVGNGTSIVRGLEVTGPGSYTCIQSVAEVGDDRCDWDRDEAVEIDPEADAEFIAHARTDVPMLLALVNEQSVELDRIRDRAESPTTKFETPADEIQRPTDGIETIRDLALQIITGWPEGGDEAQLAQQLAQGHLTLLARVDEQDAEIQRLRAVAEAAQKVIEVARLNWTTSDEWVAKQGDAEVALLEAMRALPAVAGQPHYHDPIECGCELTAADAPKATR